MIPTKQNNTGKDSNNFGRLIEDSIPRIKGILLSKGFGKDENDLDDIIQEASIGAYRNFHTFDITKGSFLTCFATIAVRKAIDISKIKATKNRNIPLNSFFEDVVKKNATSWDSDDKSFATKVLSELSHKDFELIHLTHVIRSSQKEIATALSIPLGTVKSKLHRVERILKGRLQKMQVCQ